MDIRKNYGAFLEKDGAGFRGQVKLTGLSNGDIDLTNSLWTYQVMTSFSIEIFFYSDNLKPLSFNLFYVVCCDLMLLFSVLFIHVYSYYYVATKVYIRRIRFAQILYL